MSLENYRNIGGRIEPSNQIEQKEALSQKLEQISLVFANHKLEQSKEEEYKLSNALKDFTPVEGIIKQPLFSLEDFSFYKHQDKIDSFIKNFYQEVDELHSNHGFNLNEIIELIELKKNAIKEYLGVTDSPEVQETKKERPTKIVGFNSIDNIEEGLDAVKYGNLEKIGFSKLDHFLEVHFDQFYSNEEKILGLDLVKKDLAIIAEYIIDNKPETAAVIGESWLLDNKIAKFLGFQEVESSKTQQNDLTTWDQLIDSDGQINKKRFEYLLEKGELPFKNTQAHIPIKEFLFRYLPVSRRGEITLKKINPEGQKLQLEISENAKIATKEWTNLLNGHGNFENFIKNKTLNDLLDKLNLESKNKYLNFLKEMFDQKVDWSDFHKYKNEEIKMVDKNIQEVMQNILYQEEKVNIN